MVVVGRDFFSTNNMEDAVAYIVMEDAKNSYPFHHSTH